MDRMCCNCAKYTSNYLKTAYGYFLCEDCWDDYICTDEGRLEYLIGICRGDYPASEFDADFLCDVAESWKKNHDRLALPHREVVAIEYLAKAKGLL
jgi:hypothetical protein